MGSASNIEQLDYCQQIPAVEAGRYFYAPDGKQADIVIRNWAKQRICFCGFIHSHVVDKKDLSLNDIEFANQLMKAYELPVLWFGLGVVEGTSVFFRFYTVKMEKENVSISPVCWEVSKK